MPRLLVTSFLLCVCAASVRADYVVYQERPGAKLKEVGCNLPKDVELTTSTAEGYLAESDAFIVNEGIAGVEIKKRLRDGKGTFIPYSQIVGMNYKIESYPEELLDGDDAMSTGNYSVAIQRYDAVMANTEIPEGFQYEAGYKKGLCYYNRGNLNACISHWSSWGAQAHNSRYTPLTYESLGKLLTLQKKFDTAREWYAKIAGLPDITENWKLKAKLGDALVDIAEKKFDEAEAKAKAVVSTAGMDAELVDSKALGMAIQAQAVLYAGNKDRYGQALGVLLEATKLDKASQDTRALVYSTRGDLLYASGQGAEARLPYLRVVCNFAETAQVPHCLLNAGGCFIEMSQAEGMAQEERDRLFVMGMRLLGECAGRHGGPDAKEAASKYRSNKSEYEAAKKRLGETDAAEGDG